MTSPAQSGPTDTDLIRRFLDGDVMRPTLLVAALAVQAGAQPAIRELRLTEEWRVGGEAEDIFGQTAMTLVDATGRVVMFDGGNGRFVVFDSAGKRIGAFGGRGQGPGEFTSRSGRYAIALGLRGDTVWTYDRAQRRFALFGPDLRLVRTFPLPEVDAARARVMSVESLLPGDQFLARAVLPESTLVVFSRDGAVLRRVAATLPDSSYARVEVQNALARIGSVPLRSSPAFATSTSGDRVALVTHVSATEYRIAVVLVSGDTVFSRSYRYRPIPVTAQMQDSAMAAFDSSLGGRQGAASAPLRTRIRELLPSVLPPLQRLHIGRDGTVWAQRNTGGAGPPEFVVLSATGDIVGLVRLRSVRAGVREVTRSAVWVTEADDDGFVSVVRLRLSSN